MEDDFNEVFACAQFINIFLSTLAFNDKKLDVNDVNLAKQKAKLQGYCDSIIEKAIEKIIPEEYHIKSEN